MTLKLPTQELLSVVQQLAMRTFHFTLMCKGMMGVSREPSMAFFFHGAGKWDTGMKGKAETPELGKELRASPGMTRLM